MTTHDALLTADHDRHDAHDELSRFDPLDGTATFPGLPGRFCLYYQPQLDLSTGAILRCEALLRWQHPSFGLLRPQATLGGTRWTDDIPDLEAWTLGQACRQAAAWADGGLPIQIALNVSAGFLLDPGFTSMLRLALADAELAPRLLAVDLPFGAVATRPREVKEVADALGAADVALIVDGVVGEARPWMVDRLDAQAWKIEVGGWLPGTDVPHPSVQRALDHAHRNGALAVAKAVETDGQLVELRAMGFDELFGEVVGPAAPPDEARAACRAAPSRLPSLFDTGR